ncbi:hypothetical protein GCM10009117_22620 [Gangjinia marincola]|uniref:Uncharacterized protein n=1 Tax=Gangjinia marincola TaxID=578463 RepID=A0ABP3XV15_9FLAO
MKTLFRVLTIAQIAYYAYDWIKNDRSFKEEFLPGYEEDEE